MAPTGADCLQNARRSGGPHCGDKNGRRRTRGKWPSRRVLKGGSKKKSSLRTPLEEMANSWCGAVDGQAAHILGRFGAFLRRFLDILWNWIAPKGSLAQGSQARGERYQLFPFDSLFSMGYTVIWAEKFRKFGSAPSPLAPTPSAATSAFLGQNLD